MGSVWLADHLALEIPCAIKFIDREQNSPEARKRFEREAKAAAQLRGQHVVQIRSTDPAGNVESAPASRAFTVDTHPPVVTLSANVPQLTNSKAVSFSISANESAYLARQPLSSIGPGWLNALTVSAAPDPVTAEERAPDGLHVRVPAPPGGPERGRYSWPFSRSFATSGAIARARLSSSASVRLAIGCGIIRNL